MLQQRCRRLLEAIQGCCERCAHTYWLKKFVPSQGSSEAARLFISSAHLLLHLLKWCNSHCRRSDWTHSTLQALLGNPARATAAPQHSASQNGGPTPDLPAAQQLPRIHSGAVHRQRSAKRWLHSGSTAVAAAAWCCQCWWHACPVPAQVVQHPRRRRLSAGQQPRLHRAAPCMRSQRATGRQPRHRRGRGVPPGRWFGPWRGARLCRSGLPRRARRPARRRGQRQQGAGLPRLEVAV